MQGILLIVVLIAAGGLVLAVKLVRAVIAQYGVFLIWWFISGHHVLGDRDCCKDRCGPRVRWRRARRRLGGLAAAAAIIAGLVISETATFALIADALLLAAVTRVRRARRQTHIRRVVRPYASALAIPASHDPDVLHGTIVVPRAIQADSKVVALMPGDFQHDARQVAAIENITGHRLGHEWTASTYRELPAGVTVPRATRRHAKANPGPWLVLSRRDMVPAFVSYLDHLAELDARPDHRTLLGGGPGGRLLWWDTSLEDPHVAFHGGSRRGKTSLLLAVAAQELARGARVTAIDPKRIGLLALAELPGFNLIYDPRDIPAMWDGVANFRKLVEDRYDQLAADPTVEFKRELLILDEVSMLSGMWAAHWRKTKTKGDPTMPPVWEDIAAAVWMGAQCRCHVWVSGQRLDYKILGGMLGSFGYRLLAGYTPQDFARLVGQTPVIRSQKPRGRCLVYSGDDPEWSQLIYAKPEEWRDWALDRARNLTGEVVRARSEAVSVSLNEAVKAKILPGSLAAKRARADDPAFPAPVGKEGQTMMYDPAALREWQAARPRALRAAR